MTQTKAKDREKEAKKRISLKNSRVSPLWGPGIQVIEHCAVFSAVVRI